MPLHTARTVAKAAPRRCFCTGRASPQGFRIFGRIRAIGKVGGRAIAPGIGTPVWRLSGRLARLLARIVCYAFSLPATAFTRQVNRATAETAQEAALAEGLAPLMGRVKRLADHVIQDRIGETD